jgi:rfaE bifunctional protein kinase chain/domain
LKKYQSVTEIFNDFNNLNVLIVGDVMLDAYLWGKVDRISPEAPVPVVAVSHKESRLGGAANVAINIKAMGAHPLLCSVIGHDRDGDELLELMKNLAMPADGMVKSSTRVTTVKTRVIGNNHQLLRVDDEMMHMINDKEAEDLFQCIQRIISEKPVHVIIFEDYDKGVLSPELIERIVALAQSRNIPTAVDPKKKNFTSYRNVSLFKPNLHELKTGLKMDIDKPVAAELEQAVAAFQKEQSIGTLMVTLSEAGVFFSCDGVSAVIPAHVRNISDVSGAGDTVISVAALCLALGLSAETMSTLANLAGGLVCEKVGVVPVDKEQLLKEAASILL